MRAWIAIVAALLVPALARAEPIPPTELNRHDHGLAHVGSGSVGFLWWRVFDADLWAPEGRFNWEAPLALSLTYRTRFSSEELTDSTIEELERIHGWPDERLTAFRADIAPCMSDVGEGDRFTAASPDPHRIVLYLNGKERCDLSMPGLRRDFLAIWLSEESRFPNQSRKMTGASP